MRVEKLTGASLPDYDRRLTRPWYAPAGSGLAALDAMTAEHYPAPASAPPVGPRPRPLPEPPQPVEPTPGEILEAVKAYQRAQTLTADDMLSDGGIDV